MFGYSKNNKRLLEKRSKKTIYRGVVWVGIASGGTNRQLSGTDRESNIIQPIKTTVGWVTVMTGSHHHPVAWHYKQPTMTTIEKTSTSPCSNSAIQRNYSTTGIYTVKHCYF